MAGGMDLGTGGKGGKKPLDTTINLVPFIDLMACTIAFLIMTAVWTNIGRLQVSSSGPGADAEQSKEESLPITIHLSDRQLSLRVGSETRPVMVLHRDNAGRAQLDELTSAMRGLKASQPSQLEVTLEAEDAVKYEDLVRVIDACVGEGFPNVSVSPVST